MLKKMVCDCVLDYTLEPLDPVLIRSGQATVHGADMAFVLTYRNGKWEPFIPGTSLKGVFRSYSERIAATLNPEFNCNPFVDEFCGKIFGKRMEDIKEKTGDYKQISNDEVYRDSCPICRLFGSLYFAGRFSPSDAYIEGEYTLEERDGIGIDRFTGGTYHGAKFNLEVLTRGCFRGSIMIRNFELWQLGLAAFLMRDFSEGYIRIGFGTSRGLGRVKGRVEKVVISYLGQPRNLQNQLVGVGELVDEKGYGFAINDRVSLNLPEAENYGLRQRYIFTGEAIDNLWEAVAPKWVDYITGYTKPQTMLVK